MSDAAGTGEHDERNAAVTGGRTTGRRRMRETAETFTSRDTRGRRRSRCVRLPERTGEALADFFERVLAAVADAEPHLDHLLLARRQRLQHRLGLLFQIEVDHGFGWRYDLAILDEVAQMRIFLLADRRLERDRLLRDF